MTSTTDGERGRIRRHPERAEYDREAVHAILDQGLVGHVGFVDGGQPFVVPMLYVRDGDSLYLHGSPQSRLVSLAAGGAPLCVTVTLVDGMVLARSVFRHSINYRSVVVFGDGRPVRDREQKLEAMRLLVEHIVPGRTAEARGPSEAELKVTEIVAMTVREASAKVRSGPPADSSGDVELPVWGGQLPLSTAVQAPIPDASCSVELPKYLADLIGTDPQAGSGGF